MSSNPDSPMIGDRFNTFDGSAHHAGPRPGTTVPDSHPTADLHYDISQIISPAKLASITTSKKMGFHCIGDTGNDHSFHHNGGPEKRLAVAELMERQLADGKGLVETPCFCYHVGDVIYPGGDEDLYEEEFYIPYSGYGNAIVATPGNHDYYGDHLASFKENFIQDSLDLKPGHRPAMNLPGFHWVLDSPVATIIGLAATSNYISETQSEWFSHQMNSADSGKALIVAVHYPPYCFDGSNNSAIRACIANGIQHSGRSPDLVISGHSHNYQRIEAPPYPVIVVGSGGASTSPVRPSSGGNGSVLKRYNDQAYGALSLIVDANAKTIEGVYNIAVTQSGEVPVDPLFDVFVYDWK